MYATLNVLFNTCFALIYTVAQDHKRRGTRFYWHDIVLLYDIDTDCTIEHMSLTRFYVLLWHCEDGLDK